MHWQGNCFTDFQRRKTEFMRDRNLDSPLQCVLLGFLYAHVFYHVSFMCNMCTQSIYTHMCTNVNMHVHTYVEPHMWTHIEKGHILGTTLIRARVFMQPYMHMHKCKEYRENGAD